MMAVSGDDADCSSVQAKRASLARALGSSMMNDMRTKKAEVKSKQAEVYVSLSDQLKEAEERRKEQVRDRRRQRPARPLHSTPRKRRLIRYSLPYGCRSSARRRSPSARKRPRR